MLTETEAKTKWCPFVRLRGKYDDAATSSFNRCLPFGNDLTPETHCWASACMAWRWYGGDYPDYAGPDKPEGKGWVENANATDNRFRWQRKRQQTGYCGLAGEPS
jgi:hypothetical protein